MNEDGGDAAKQQGRRIEDECVHGRLVDDRYPFPYSHEAGQAFHRNFYPLQTEGISKKLRLQIMDARYLFKTTSVVYGKPDIT